MGARIIAMIDNKALFQSVEGVELLPDAFYSIFAHGEVALAGAGHKRVIAGANEVPVRR